MQTPHRRVEHGEDDTGKETQQHATPLPHPNIKGLPHQPTGVTYIYRGPLGSHPQVKIFAQLAAGRQVRSWVLDRRVVGEQAGETGCTNQASYPFLGFYRPSG